ncbi:MAG: DUF3037 domain-containing protein [Thermodesulfobacteriota bacterium]
MPEARYCLIQYIPDLIKNEPTNIGVLVQSPGHISFRLLSDFSGFKDRASEADLQMLSDLAELISQRLSARKQLIYDFARNREVSVPVTDPRFLDYLAQIYDRQIQFTESRPCYLVSDDIRQLEETLQLLFKTMVETEKAAVTRKPVPKRQPLGAVLRRALRSLIKLELVQENYSLQGSVEHIISFSYANGQRVLIDTVQLDIKSGREQLRRAQACVIKWMDIAQTLEQPGRRFRKSTVFAPATKRSKEYDQSLILLARYSDELIDYQQEGEAFISRVYAELGQARDS